jgi:hypothetical protein
MGFRDCKVGQGHFVCPYTPVASIAIDYVLRYLAEAHAYRGIGVEVVLTNMYRYNIRCHEFVSMALTVVVFIFCDKTLTEAIKPCFTLYCIQSSRIRLFKEEHDEQSNSMQCADDTAMLKHKQSQFSTCSKRQKIGYQSTALRS